MLISVTSVSTILNAVERYVRNSAEDVRDLTAVVNENDKRLLEQNESVRGLVNENGKTLSNIGVDVRDIKTYNEKSKSDEDKRVRGKKSWTVLKFFWEAYILLYEDEVFRWLFRTDPFVDHNAARAKWEPETGKWFIDSGEYRQWKKQCDSWLWLHSIPGGGKTILW